MSVRAPRLGTLLEPSCGPLGPHWRPLGPSWGALGPSWGPLASLWGSLGGLLGYLGAILGAYWAVLECREAEKARTPKSFKNHWRINDFCLLVPSWECSWRPLGPSWSVGKPKRREHQNLSNIEGKTVHFAPWGPLGSALGGLLGRFGNLLSRLGASGSRKGVTAKICPTPKEKQ